MHYALRIYAFGNNLIFASCGPDVGRCPAMLRPYKAQKPGRISAEFLGNRGNPPTPHGAPLRTLIADKNSQYTAPFHPPPLGRILS